MKMSLVSTLKVTIFTLSLIGYLGAQDRSKADFAIQLYGSAENLVFILKAENVAACRLKAPRKESGKFDSKKLTDYKTLKYYTPEEAIEVPEVIRAELRAILKDPATHDLQSEKACAPIYGVRFVFTDGTKSLTLNLCFICNLLATADADSVVGRGSFNPASARLMAIARALFPNDTDLSDIR